MKQNIKYIGCLSTIGIICITLILGIYIKKHQMAIYEYKDMIEGYENDELIKAISLEFETDLPKAVECKKILFNPKTNMMQFIFKINYKSKKIIPITCYFQDEEEDDVYHINFIKNNKYIYCTADTSRIHWNGEKTEIGIQIEEETVYKIYVYKTKD